MKDFEQYMKTVDKILIDQLGFTHEDISSDYDWMDCFKNNIKPYEAVLFCLEYILFCLEYNYGGETMETIKEGDEFQIILKETNKILYEGIAEDDKAYKYALESFTLMLSVCGARPPTLIAKKL